MNDDFLQDLVPSELVFQDFERWLCESLMSFCNLKANKLPNYHRLIVRPHKFFTLGRNGYKCINSNPLVVLKSVKTRFRLSSSCIQFE